MKRKMNFTAKNDFDDFDDVVDDDYAEMMYSK